MANKIDLTTVSGGYYSQKQLNANFTRIRDGFNKALFRDGTIPNQMLADLDMNSNDILNVNNLSVDSLVIGGSATLPALVSRSQEVQNPGAGVVTLTTNSYYVGNDSLSIYVDGAKQIVDVDYTEVGDANSISTSVVFLAPFAGTEEVEIIIDATYQKGECSTNSAIVNWISLADYICAGDDPDTALSSALADCCTYNRSLYIPAGTYNLSAPGVITDCDISIFGDGPGVTVLIFDNCDGFQFNYNTTIPRRALLRDMSIRQEQKTTGTAITFDNNLAIAGPGFHTIVDNIDFVDKNPAAGDFRDHSWDVGIAITGVSDGSITNNIFLSDYAVADTCFVKFEPSITTNRWSITGNSIGFCDKAIWLESDASSHHDRVFIDSNDFEGVNTAVYSEGASQLEAIFISNNTMEFLEDGIVIDSFIFDIHDNYIVHNADESGKTIDGEITCIRIYGDSSRGIIHDNQIGTGSTLGHDIGNCVTLDGDGGTGITRVNVHDNVMDYGYIGVVVDNDVTACTWFRNMFGANLDFNIDDNTLSTDRNFHDNGATTHYRNTNVIDITTALVGTPYTMTFDTIVNGKNELDLAAVPISIITIPAHVRKIRARAYAIVEATSAPPAGTDIVMLMWGTNVDGDPLPAPIGTIDRRITSNGEQLGIAVESGAINVVAGSTIYLHIYADAAFNKNLVWQDLYVENIT